jgi:hypothetical protein
VQIDQHDVPQAALFANKNSSAAKPNISCPVEVEVRLATMENVTG